MQTISIPIQGQPLEIPRGCGSSIANFLKGNYEAKLKIPGEGYKPNNPPSLRFRNFLGPHNTYLTN